MLMVDTLNLLGFATSGPKSCSRKSAREVAHFGPSHGLRLAELNSTTASWEEHSVF